VYYSLHRPSQRTSAHFPLDFFPYLENGTALGRLRLLGAERL
jgi:hypothetical protein